MMIKVEAYFREEKLDDVLDALAEMNVHGITVYQVMGCGAQHGVNRYVRGHQNIPVNMLPKIKIEVVVGSEKWEQQVMEVIREKAFTGHHGDGKIFSYSVRDALRIRTGERGEEAVFSHSSLNPVQNSPLDEM
ncbi:MAG: P-II family nitrogen regulator [Oscillospiraceae bacterium]|nr:P-II family nitrogen regulator [Oscillospiraceae bacterium]